MRAFEAFREVWDRSALRGCDRVGDGLRLRGRPFVENLGHLRIGRRFQLSSTPVQSHLVVGPGGRLEIGDEVSIGYGAAISAQLEIQIGDGAQLGPFAMLLDSDFHQAGDHASAGRSGPISIGAGVRLGSRVTVLRGAAIGAGAEVMAGSVVGDVVAPGSRVGGVPARRLDQIVDLQAPIAPGHLPEAVQTQVGAALGLPYPPALQDGPAQLAQWDSLATLKIILALEERFLITLDERDMQQVSSVADLVAVVERAAQRRR